MPLTRTKYDIVGTSGAGFLTPEPLNSEVLFPAAPIFKPINPESEVFLYIKCFAQNSNIQGQAIVKVWYSLDEAGATSFVYSEFPFQVSSYRTSERQLNITHPLMKMLSFVGVQLIAAKSDSLVEYYVGMIEVS